MYDPIAEKDVSSRKAAPLLLSATRHSMASAPQMCCRASRRLRGMPQHAASVPLATCQVPSGPCSTSRVNDPD
jgi:hypothetical protein